jgi:hypothetical protein
MISIPMGGTPPRRHWEPEPLSLPLPVPAVPDRDERQRERNRRSQSEVGELGDDRRGSYVIVIDVG